MIRALISARLVDRHSPSGSTSRCEVRCVDGARIWHCLAVEGDIPAHAPAAVQPDISVSENVPCDVALRDDCRVDVDVSKGQVALVRNQRSASASVLVVSRRQDDGLAQIAVDHIDQSKHATAKHGVVKVAFTEERASEIALRKAHAGHIKIAEFRVEKHSSTDFDGSAISFDRAVSNHLESLDNVGLCGFNFREWYQLPMGDLAFADLSIFSASGRMRIGATNGVMLPALILKIGDQQASNSLGILLPFGAGDIAQNDYAAETGCHAGFSEQLNPFLEAPGEVSGSHLCQLFLRGLVGDKRACARHEQTSQAGYAHQGLEVAGLRAKWRNALFHAGLDDNDHGEKCAGQHVGPNPRDASHEFHADFLVEAEHHD